MTELHPETFEEYHPGGPISSLRRLEVLYGAITEAAEGEIDSKYDLYHTPGELDEFVVQDNENRYLVTLEVDVTGDSPELNGISADPLQPSDVAKLGYARYPWGRGIDHSITERGAKGGWNIDKTVRYSSEKLEKWSNASGKEEAVGRVADENPDGWVIRDLQTLSSRDDIADEIEQHLRPAFPSADSPRVVATVAIKLDPDSLEAPPEGTPENGYYYPGQLPILNDGMVARKNHKLATKNVPSPSKGEGTCMVTGERGEVFGTAEDPLAFFTVQHSEKFANLKKVESWRSHPVSSEAALLLQSGTSLVENCSRTRDGLRVYTLPYVVDCDHGSAEWLYGAIEDADETSIHRIQQHAENVDESFAEALRFYVIGVRNDSGDINVLHEVPNVDIYWPREVGKAHLDVLESSLFGSAAGFHRPDPDGWRHIAEATQTEDVVKAITSGRYARDTLAFSDADAPTSNDPREWLVTALLTGESVPADKLLSQYVERIASATNPEDENFPTYLVLTQYAQLEALARADLLSTPDDRPELKATPRTTMNETTGPLDFGDSLPDPTDLEPDGNVKQYHARKYRLERFLEERDAFQDNDERCGAFLFGVFLGELANHQSYNRDMNRTLRDQHPADRITAERMHRVYPDLQQRSGVYANGDQLFPETERLLKDVFAEAPPDDWSLPVEDVRFFYALGLAYGSDAQSQAKQLRKDLGVYEDEDESGDSTDE
ncbi:type I-B CRISPR-associated protein Cas8b/Csh1 [Halorussus sp. MSC15.2]|uniref:type I-B CRISPR-associated protein Cas8b/Csh1 n=1 Tax=Halorussus sp. MSC15.2 TaxID=2283638 RepID=UPI0013D34483|nr:type I-B CRISPR-associated protein Cas8b/Csh1 [Halorussus sp. MSC15.2]NEU59280.1 type I-B CRISPR-associated protein Cas8b/Csh1 [Halorussus sp. MSC15.2]